MKTKMTMMILTMISAHVAILVQQVYAYVSSGGMYVPVDGPTLGRWRSERGHRRNRAN